MIRGPVPVKQLGRSRDLAIIVLCVVVVVVIVNLAWNVRLALQDYRQSLVMQSETRELAADEPEEPVLPATSSRSRKHKSDTTRATFRIPLQAPERPKD